MRVVGGEFVANDEVNQMVWLPLPEARRRLLADRDRKIVLDLDPASVTTWPCVIVRHGSAGERASWKGDDRERPLDALGEQQAERLVPLLAAYGVKRVISADVLRCMQTVGPFAASNRILVESEPLLSESGYAAEPKIAVDRLIEVVRTKVPSAACSQGKTIPGLVTSARVALKASSLQDASVRKGGLLVMHLQHNPDLTLVATERWDPLA
jgi:8-oxo-dGTP diphosphatase